MPIKELFPDRILIDQAANHIRNLRAVVDAMVPDKSYDCSLRVLLQEIDAWIEGLPEADPAYIQ